MSQRLADRLRYVCALLACAAGAVQAQVPELVPTRVFSPAGPLPSGFEAVRFYPSGVPIAAGDVNGDGRADLLYRSGPVADTRTDDLGDLSGQSLLFFGPALSDVFDQLVYATLTPAGDTDADGFADAYAVDGGTLVVYRGSAAGYGAGVPVPSSTASLVTAFVESRGRESGDLDGDGRADLVIQTPPQSVESPGLDLVVLFGSGTVVSVVVPVPTDAGTPTADYLSGFVLGDLDGDGRDEVVFSEEVRDGDVQTRRVRAASVSPTGEVVARDLFQWMQDSRYFRSPLSLGDPDGDGDLDVSIRDRFNGNTDLAFLNEPAGFDPVPYEANRFAGDLDGDGTTDVVAVVNSGFEDATISFGPAAPDRSTRTLSFARSRSVRLSDASLSVRLFDLSDLRYGDLDGDGEDDLMLALDAQGDRGRTGFGRLLVTVTEAGDVEGRETLYDGTTYPAWNVRYAAGLGDVDGDGIDDVAVVHGPVAFGADPRVEVYVGGTPFLNGPARVLRAAGPSGRLVPSDVAGVDFDGDGVRDIAVTFVSTDVQTPASPSAAVWFGGDALDDQPGWTYTCDDAACQGYGDAYNLGVGDLNADGVRDVVLGGRGVSVLYGGPRPSEPGARLSGDRVAYAAGTPGRTPGETRRVEGGGDVTGDGVDDVVTCGVTAGCEVILGDASEPFAQTRIALGAQGTGAFTGVSLTVADVDGDGTADVLLAGADRSTGAGPQIDVHIGGPAIGGDPDETVSLAPWLLPDVGLFVGELTRIPDLDGDGDDEILVGAGSGSAQPGRAQILAGGTYEVWAELVSPNGTVALGANNNNVNSEVHSAIGDFDGDGTLDALLPQQTDTNAAPEGSRLLVFALDLETGVGTRPSLPTGPTVTVGPNPARGPLRVTLHGAAALEAVVEVVDVLGRRVALERRALAAGAAVLVLETGGWAPGPYLVRIEAGATREVRTVTVVR